MINVHQIVDGYSYQVHKKKSLLPLFFSMADFEIAEFFV
jgi:hypothetical protein